MFAKRIILASSCVSLLVPSLRAADPSVFVWDGHDGSSTSFSQGTNWATDTAPDGNDLLLFPSAVNRVVTGIDAYAGFRIFFNPLAESYTLSGTGATLFDFTADTTSGSFYSAGANAPKIENNSSSLQTINVPLTLTSSLGFSEINPVDGSLVFGSAIIVTAGQQLRIFGNNGNSATFNGVISGTGSTVAVNGNSNVIYGAANTYSGDTFINAGSLSFAQGGSLAAGTVQLGDTNATGATATLRISDADGGTTMARPIIVRAGSTGVKTIAAANTTGTNTISGTIALSDDVTFDVVSGGGLTASGVISGAETVNKTGAGLLTLSGANSFTGGLVLNGGRTRPITGNTMSGGITMNAGGILEINAVGSATDSSVQFNTFFGVAGNGFVFNGGTIEMTAATTANVDRLMIGRGVTANAGGATFDIQGAYTTFTEGIFNQLRFNGASVVSGSGTLTKNGGGRIQFQNTASTFTGPVIVNNGTLEATGTALGTAVATNTVTVNGGNWALSGDASQATTLNGGAISTNGASRAVNGTIDVTAISYIFLNEFWRDFDSAAPTTILVRNLTVNGVVSGDDPLGVAVNRAGWSSNNGTTILKNAGNTYSGTLTVGKNLRLENNATAGFGKTLGTASIVLADAGLNLRDNGDATGQTGTVFNYGNNVSTTAPTGIFNRGTMAGSVFIDVNRASGTVAANNTFRLGTLTLDRALTVSGGNGYAVEFSGASTFAGNAVFNTTTGSLAFSGGLTADAAGRTLTKTGAGALSFTSAANYTGATTVNGGTLTVSGTGGALNGTPSLALTNAALNIDNSAAILADRVGDTATISLANSSINFTSLTGAATNTSETVGAVTLTSGANTIAANQANAGAISALTLASLTRQASATVRLVGSNLGQAGNTSRIILADQSADVALLSPAITINGTDFAQYLTATDSGFVRGVTAVNYVTDPADDTAFNATQNLRLTGTTTTSLTASRSLNTVNFANGADTRVLALGDQTLTLAGSGMIVGINAASITGTTLGGLTAGSSEFFITNNAALNIGAPIRDNGAIAVGLTKTGNGTLTLSGPSTFTGNVSITQGALSVNDVADAGLSSALGAGNSLALSGNGVTTATTFQFTGPSDSTNRALTVGAPGATFDVTTAGAVLGWNGTATSNGSITKIGAGTLAFGGVTSIAGNANVNAGTLAFGGATNVAGNVTVSAATLAINGATTTIVGNLNVANGTGGTSTVTSSGGGTLSVGSGSSNVINVGYETVSSTVNNTGSVNLSGLSSFTANVGTIGIGGEGPGANGTGVNSGTLILAQNNTITASTSILVGDSGGDGGVGTRALTFGSGTNDVTTPLLTVGGRKYSGVSTIGAGGTLILDNGAGRTALNVGVNSVGTGTVPVSTMDLSGGTFTASLSNVLVGARAGGDNGDATATLNLGTSAATNVNINVGTGFAVRVGAIDYSTGTQPTNQLATGTMVIGGGTVSITSTNASSSAVVVGHFNNTVIAISGATAANAATGTLTINGGTVSVTSSGTTNAINLAPKTIFTGTVGSNAANGTLNISGGSLTVNNQILGNSTVAGATSTLNLTGGVLNMQAKNITDITNLTFSGGTLRNLGTLNRALTQTGETSLLDVAANNSTISGAYAVTDGDVNIATTRILNASGGTILSGTSTLLVNGTLQGSLTANAGSTVTGAGTVAAFTLAGGTVRPGNSPGVLNSGNLILNGGTLAFEFDGPAAGTGYDQLNVTGTVGLSANTALSLAFGYVPAVGTAFTIVNNDAADLIAFSNGALFTYAGTPLADDTRFTTPQGMEFEIDYNGGINTNDVVLTTIVPEPASAVMLLTGLGLIAGRRRTRRGSRVN